jgi:hypothetical protein
MRIANSIQVLLGLLVVCCSFSCKPKGGPTNLEAKPSSKDWPGFICALNESFDNFQLVQDTVCYNAIDFLQGSLKPTVVDSVIWLMYSSNDTIFNGLRQWIYIDIIVYPTNNLASVAGKQSYLRYNKLHRFDNRFSSNYLIDNVIIQLKSPGLLEFKKWPELERTVRSKIIAVLMVNIEYWVECPFEDECFVVFG